MVDKEYPILFCQPMQRLRDLLPDKNKKLHTEMFEKGVAKQRRHIESAKERGAEAETIYGSRLLREGIPALVKAIEDWKKQQRKAPVPSNAYVELNELNPRVVAFIALRSIIDSLSQRRPLSSAAIKLGAKIEDEAHYNAFSNHPNFRNIIQGADKRPNYKTKRYYLNHSHKNEAKKGHAEAWETWGTRIKLHIGTVLITLVKESTGIIDYVMISTGKRGPARFITSTKNTEEWIRGMTEFSEALSPFWMPLKDFPVQWSNKWQGGYSDENGLPPLPLIKTKDKEWLRKSNEEMTQVMSAVNSLQNTSFKVNNKVLNTLSDIWENNIPIGSLPQREDEQIPVLDPKQADDPHELKMWKRRAAHVYDINASSRSRRILVLNTLSVAKRYAASSFYLPHQCDFRGRTYVVPPYLNHQGPDISKALLVFDRKLHARTDDNLKWLHLHGANTFGVKGTEAQRLQWASENQANILKLAQDHRGSLDFLGEADETFQFLAYAYEVERLHAEGSKFATNLPCQMDASNNGLQILGMLTRDSSACVATNVADNKEPQDIYQLVADEARKAVEAEIHTNEYAALWLAFGITRGCAKRPTMTQPYGSTPHSCRNYVNQWYLEQIEKNGGRGPFKEEEKFVACAYLSKKIWEAINVVVGKPREAMGWLQDTARKLTELEKPFDWVSPSGFPCHQAYPKWVDKSIRTKIGEKIYRVKFREDMDKLSSKRQAQGSSPNFVHSLDAACLHLTVNKCEQHGIKDFAMVHDSYGTHCVNAVTLQNEIKQTLFDIFSEDQLLNLKLSLENQHTGLTLSDLPAYGEFDISEVLNSKYVFS